MTASAGLRVTVISSAQTGVTSRRCCAKREIARKFEMVSLNGEDIAKGMMGRNAREDGRLLQGWW